MVEFPDFSNLNSSSGMGGILSLPSSSYSFFWLWILGGVWMIITFALYFRDKERIGKSNLISSMAISCFAILVLATLGSVAGFISMEIMIYLIVFSFLIIAIWFFSHNN